MTLAQPTRAGGRLDLGLVPIVDFDGTLADLPVNWRALRNQLGVTRIEDLWADAPGGTSGPWEQVAHAEREAAARARAIEPVRLALVGVPAFAVLTSNSATAVDEFCSRDPGLQAGLVLVVGRETLCGPKTDFGCFRAGFELCREATDDLRGESPLFYAGDQPYELDFARELGAVAVDAREHDGTTAGRSVGEMA